MIARLITTAVIAATVAVTAAEEVPPEYRVKAAYLYNFVKYVEWPRTDKSSILICIAGQNPFGDVLTELIRNERVRGLPLATEVILEPRADCDVLFTPKTSNVSAYLHAATGLPTLTVGETPRFLEQGGIVRFVPSGQNVRFEINPGAAERSKLRISSRLLQLARIVEPEVEER
jgi:hypothetical protein